MRLHSDSITYANIQTALRDAKDEGHVHEDVYFHILETRGSRTRSGAFEIQLGCTDKVKGDGRGWKNTGNRGADSGEYGTYAATYDEWGWFIAELYELDRDLVFGHYKTFEGFNAYTKNAYII